MQRRTASADIAVGNAVASDATSYFIAVRAICRLSCRKTERDRSSKRASLHSKVSSEKRLKCLLLINYTSIRQVTLTRLMDVLVFASRSESVSIASDCSRISCYQRSDPSTIGFDLSRMREIEHVLSTCSPSLPQFAFRRISHR